MTEPMTEPMLERSHTGWDIALGALLVVGGLIILGHVVLATAVSVLFIAWIALIFGLVGLVGSLFRIGKGGFWQALLSGGLLTVLGVVMLRNPGAAAVTLTLVAGAMFLTIGVVRVIAASALPEHRVALVLSGVLSAALGLIVLLNLFTFSYTLLGVLLGVEVLMDGITMMFVGRLRLPHLDTHGTRVAHP